MHSESIPSDNQDQSEETVQLVRGDTFESTSDLLNTPPDKPKEAFPSVMPLIVYNNGGNNNGNNGSNNSNGTSTSGAISSPSAFSYDDLLGDLQLCSLWTRRFGKDTPSILEAWRNFRRDALKQYEDFDKKLELMEDVVASTDDGDDLLDLEVILDRRSHLDSIWMDVDEYDADFDEVSKTFEEFSQCIPSGEQRMKVEVIIGSLRQRYFNVLQDMNRQREMFRWIIPRLQRYQSSVAEVNLWLDSAEVRSKPFVTNINNRTFILQHEHLIRDMANEVVTRKPIYEDILEPAKGIVTVANRQTNIFEVEIDRVMMRWDVLCVNINNCLNRAVMEKKSVALDNASEEEKIDIRIIDEIKMCNCVVPYKMEKVDSGKYRFGTSKAVRLIRMYGTSIVVRIGGGWENLYNVLLKLDPCREKLFGLHSQSKKSEPARSPRSNSPNPPKNHHANAAGASKIPVPTNRVAERRGLTDENGADIIMSHSSSESSTKATTNGHPKQNPDQLQKAMESLINPGTRRKEKKMADSSVTYPWNASTRTSSISSSLSMENLDSCVKFNPLRNLSKSMNGSTSSSIPTFKQKNNSNNSSNSNTNGLSGSSSVDNLNTFGSKKTNESDHGRGKLGYTALSEDILTKPSTMKNELKFNGNFLFSGGHPKNMPGRRISLVERQAQYAQKRAEVS